MNRTTLTILLVLLAFFGIADAWYLTASALTDTALSCDLGAVLDGCNIVAKSEYSKIMGVPLAAFGVLFYSLMFVAAGLLFVFKNYLLDRALFWFVTIGALASIAFLFLQFVFIKALCIYCIASAVASFMSWFVTRDLLRTWRTRQVETPVAH